MAKTLINTARLLGEEIELETYVPDNKAYQISTMTFSDLVKNTLGWRYWPKDNKDKDDEAFYAFDHNIADGTKTYAKGRNKMEDLETAFKKLPLSAFTLTDLQPSLQLKQYIELSDRVANNLGSGTFLRPASIKTLETAIKFYHGNLNFREGHMCIVQNVSLLVLFLFSKENRKVLHPFIREIVEKIVEEKEVEMKTLVKHLQHKNKEELKLTRRGKMYFYELVEKFFLKCLEKNSFQLEKRNYATNKGDVVTAKEALLPEYLFRRAYEHLCWTQEVHFKDKQRAFWVPYVVSSIKRPFFLSLTPQSLVYLSLETIGDKIECNACEDGTSETYYGSTWTGTAADRTDEGNTTGVCVRLLKNYLKELGISSKDMESGFLTSFVGSWESAQKRIKVFREEQNKRYSQGDHMNLFDYYSTLLTLTIDYNIKFLAGLSNQKKYVNEEELQQSLKDYNEALEKEWKESGFGKKSFILVREGWYKIWGKFIKPLLQYGTLFLYKAFQLILNHPFLRELMLKAVEEWVNSMCLNFSVDKTKQEMKNGELKTSAGVDYVRQKDDVIERFFYDEGRWVEASEQEKKEIIEKDQAEYWGKFYGDSMRLLSVMSDYVSFGHFDKAVKNAELVNSAPITAFLEGLAELPVVGSVFKTVGTDKIKTMLLAYAVSNGNRIFSKILERNMQKIDALFRFSVMFFQAAKCLLGWNTSIMVIDGRYIGGKTLRLKFEKCFQNALHNIPYYAIMILIQEEKARKSNNLEYIIKSFVEETFVGATKKQEKEQYKLAIGEETQKRIEDLQKEYKTFENYAVNEMGRKKKGIQASKLRIKQMEAEIEKIFKNDASKKETAKKLLRRELWRKKNSQNKKDREKAKYDLEIEFDPKSLQDTTYWQDQWKQTGMTDLILLGLVAGLAAPAVAPTVGNVATGAKMTTAKAYSLVTGYLGTLSSGEGKEASTSAAKTLLSKVNPTVAKEAIKIVFTEAIKKAIKDPVGTIEVGGMAYQYVMDRSGELKIKIQNAYDTFVGTPPMKIQMVLEENPIHRIMFDLRLKGFIAKFRGKENDAYSSALQETKEIDYLNARGIVASKGSIFVAWPERHEFLDLDAINDFFRVYGPIENLL